MCVENPTFKLKNLKKTFLSPQKKVALDIKNLELYPGQVNIILGQNGSGKSTLLNLLGLLDLPDKEAEGISYRCDGGYIPYKNLKWRKRITFRRRDFGFIFQNGHLLGHLNCINNVALPLALEGVSHKVRKNIAKQKLREVDLEEKMRSRPTEISGGEYQRTAVMRALVHNPRVVFADEPTGNIDPINADKIMELLYKWLKGETIEKVPVKFKSDNSLLSKTLQIKFNYDEERQSLVFYGIMTENERDELKRLFPDNKEPIDQLFHNSQKTGIYNTLIIVTHNIPLSYIWGDNIIILDNGSIYKSIKKRSLKSGRELYDLVEELHELRRKEKKS